MGGGFGVPLDVVIGVVGIAASGFLVGILQEMGADAYRAWRKALLDLRRKARQPEQGLREPSFSITIGSLWLVYDTPLTDEEFQESLTVAYTFAEGLPDEEINHPRGTRGRYYVWDGSSRTWQGPSSP